MEEAKKREIEREKKSGQDNRLQIIYMDRKRMIELN